MDELAVSVFDNEKDRKEYEKMLERRYEYIAAKQKERVQEWSQYWPSDQPETLVCSIYYLLFICVNSKYVYLAYL